jgi:hypothetical protein
MFKAILIAVLGLFVGVSSSASAQVSLTAPARIAHITQFPGTVGPATAVAITPSAIGNSAVSWEICNDSVNTSTYLLVGVATDVSTDGTMLAPGACYVCPNCTGDLLKATKVKGQAASNGYSVKVLRQ